MSDDTRKVRVEEYHAWFLQSEARRVAALDRAWSTRNFEIELYWKRATYFWAILAALFAAYGFAEKSEHGDSNLRLVISCLGLVLSSAWYLVNRGSAAWQKNWEAHIDALEEKVTGPLYRVVASPSSYSLWKLHKPLNVSPSKITIIVSLFVAFIWLILTIAQLHIDPQRSFNFQKLVVMAFSVGVVVWMVAGGRTGKALEEFDFELRGRKWMDRN